jgi:hypothetical protein
VTLTPDERDALEDRNTERLDDAPRAAHRLEVSLSLKRGLNYHLRCLGDRESRCHLWQEDEADPTTLQEHEYCAAVDWWHYDTQSSVESYVGPDRDSVVTGEVNLLMWGENGIEWEYLETPEARP